MSGVGTQLGLVGIAGGSIVLLYLAFYGRRQLATTVQPEKLCTKPESQFGNSLNVYYIEKQKSHEEQGNRISNGKSNFIAIGIYYLPFNAIMNYSNN